MYYFQIAFYDNQAHISSENFQTKIYYGIQKQNLKQDIQTIKNSSTTKSKKKDTQLSIELRRASLSMENLRTIPTIQC